VLLPELNPFDDVGAPRLRDQCRALVDVGVVKLRSVSCPCSDGCNSRQMLDQTPAEDDIDSFTLL
jgi:hypothetical protein